MSDWYYAVNNEQKGPVNESELKAQFAARKLSPDNTLVWKDGMENWTPAVQVAAFSFREPPPPATVSGTTLSPAPVAVARAPGANNPESATPLTMASIMGPGEALEVDAEDAETNKVFGILAYLGILWLVPLLAAKNSPFARYHANQGLVLFIVEFAVLIVLQIIEYTFDMIGLSFISFLLGSLVVLGILALVIIGIINAAAGKCVPLPVIGKFKLIK
jgi:uncharacterized membrane protein